METNTVTPEWGCNPFWSDSILFNESYVASVMAALTLLTLTLGVNGLLNGSKSTHIMYRGHNKDTIIVFLVEFQLIGNERNWPN